MIKSIKGRFLVELEELGTQVQKESCQLGSTMSCTALVNDVAELPTLEALPVFDCATQKPQTYAVQATWAIIFCGNQGQQHMAKPCVHLMPKIDFLELLGLL